MAQLNRKHANLTSEPPRPLNRQNEARQCIAMHRAYRGYGHPSLAVSISRSAKVVTSYQYSYTVCAILGVEVGCLPDQSHVQYLRTSRTSSAASVTATVTAQFVPGQLNVIAVVSDPSSLKVRF